MVKLGDLYTDFSRIDLDTRGGYSRVADVKMRQNESSSGHCAFKLMRHDIDYQTGLERFAQELRLLVKIDKKAPSQIVRIYDSGFAPIELSHALHLREKPSLIQEINSSGMDVGKFRLAGEFLQAKEPGKWLPYLAVELAPYDDNLLRQVHFQPQNDPDGLYRLPTGEIIAMAIQLLDVMDYLNKEHHRAYMDWKPEHIFWGGLKKQAKLIDWNVTALLDDTPGEEQNIRDDIRLFCGAVLYVSLTFVDPDNPVARIIGPRPTTELNSPVPEIRRRYWTDNPNFHQRGIMLDSKIKLIVRKGLDPNRGYDSTQELREILLDYAKRELGIIETDLLPGSEPKSEYFKALTELRSAQSQFLQAQQRLAKAGGSNIEKLEYARLFEAIKRALTNFPNS